MVEYFAGMISTDNPRHARLRRIVSAAFNPRRIKSIEDTIEEVANRVIERASGLGECDFAMEIAAPFPLEIICDMMGVPAVRVRHGLALLQHHPERTATPSTSPKGPTRCSPSSPPARSSPS